MSENKIDPTLVEKARAAGRAAREGNGGKAMEHAKDGATVSPSHSPVAKKETQQNDGGANFRSLPKEQQQQRDQQQRSEGRGGR